MKKLMYLCAGIMLSCLFCSFTDEKEWENEEFVKKAFELLNENKSKLLYDMLIQPDGRRLKVPSYSRTNKAFFFANNVILEKESSSSDRVRYSCDIPGAVIVAISNVSDRQLFTNGHFCKDVRLEGYFKIRTDTQTGEKKIIIDNEKNPFSIYLNIAYNSEKIPIMVNENDFNDNLLVGVYITSQVYVNALGDPNYIDNVIAPELGECLKKNNFLLIVASGVVFDAKKNIKRVVIGRQKDKKKQASSEKPENLKESNSVSSNNVPTTTQQKIGFFSKIGMFISNYWRRILTGVFIIIAIGYILLVVTKYHKRKRELEKIREEAPSSKQIQSFIAPTSDPWWVKKKIEYFSLDFGNNNQQIIFGSYTYNDITASETTRKGWALAALGKLITKDCSPEKFKRSLEDYEMKVIPSYNADIAVYERDRNKLIKLQGDVKSEKSLDFYLLYKSFQQLTEKLERGILMYAHDAGILPFAFYIQIINDNQGHYDRFIRQGVIMGMIDFFMKYRDNEIIKPYFENLIAARHNMISSDDQMSFFEVRAPMHCTTKQYAEILKEVLHCANPTIQYCDTEKLMKIAEKEIPGIMDLLVHYPLRLIDPGNQTLGGFYEFNPYRHAMWVRYTPPLNVGQVQERYHEVLDMTLPNSSGLNIRLFSDPYAAIPVMFHEYNHYMEDPNEASVHLKTHVFSLKFYRKYKDAKPDKDIKFVHLNRLLGKNINPDNFRLLNDMIIQYYGCSKSKKEAVTEAENDLNQKNFFIEDINSNLTWCPEVKMPFLSNDGDKYNADLIRKIRIRFAQVPREITKEEFLKKRKSFKPIKNSIKKKYRRGIYNMLKRMNDKEEDNKKIKCYGDWKSLKEWCINNGYITRYKGNEEIDYEEQLKQTFANYKEQLKQAFGANYEEQLKQMFGTNYEEQLKQMFGANYK